MTEKINPGCKCSSPFKGYIRSSIN